MIEELFDDNFKSLIQCFKLNDTDGSGLLNFEQFKLVVEGAEGFEDFLVDWCSGKLPGGKTTINLKEFLDIIMIHSPVECMWENVEKEIERTFHDIDADGDGCIDQDELGLRLNDLALILNGEEQMKLFHDADKNGDGVISLQEFKDKMFDFIGLGSS